MRAGGIGETGECVMPLMSGVSDVRGQSSHGNISKCFEHRLLISEFSLPCRVKCLGERL